MNPYMEGLVEILSREDDFGRDWRYVLGICTELRTATVEEIL
tara:strand:- start:609 stop:734 length:126 start_codon:yes stop_codon:yes gene_type:complete